MARLDIQHPLRAAVSFAALCSIVLAAGCQEAASASHIDASPDRSFLRDSYPAQFDAGTVVLDGRLIARGDSLFQGVIGQASCVMCHGPLLRGSTEGTNLRDDTWHDGDGTYESIVSTIVSGVEKPDHMSMPARGGMPLSDRDVQALAAYVYWLVETAASRGEESLQPGGGISG